MRWPIIVLALLVTSAVSRGELPSEVQTLSNDHQKEIRRINEDYLKKLGQLLTHYKQKGDQDAVASIEQLISKTKTAIQSNAVIEVSRESAILSRLVGKWKRDYDSSIWEFKDTKSGSFNTSTPLTIEYNEGSKRVSIVSAKWVDTLTWTADTDVLQGEDRKGRRYRLNRIK